MSHNQAPVARLTTVALFPTKYFLENLVVREDNSVLVTAMNDKELWYVPPSENNQEVTPICLHTFDEPTTGIVEVKPDIFLILTCNLYTTHEAFAQQVDLRDWQPGLPVVSKLLCRFPEQARGLNGCCLIAPGVVLVADCFAGLIWRLELAPNGGVPSIRVWLKHESMGYYPGTMKPEQPGVNGVRYAAKSSYLFYTATAKKLLMRVKVDANNLEAVAAPELVVAGRMGDDFCLDEDAKVIYLTTHRQNTIDVVSMEPGLNSGYTQSVAGDPFTEDLIGPSSGAWSRSPGDYGRTAYFIMDGGTASPPPGGPRPAKLFRVDFQRLPKTFPGVGWSEPVTDYGVHRLDTELYGNVGIDTARASQVRRGASA